MVKTCMRRDFSMMKESLAISLFFGICISFMNIQQGYALSAASMAGYYWIVTSMSVEERFHIDTLLGSLPIDRAAPVAAKYFELLVVVVITALIGVGIRVGVVVFAAAHFNVTPQAPSLITELFTAITGALILPFLMLPLFYRFGFLKSRLMGLSVFIVFGALTGMLVLAKKPDTLIYTLFTHSSRNSMYGIMLKAAFTGCAGYISYRLSRNIYVHKEF